MGAVSSDTLVNGVEKPLAIHALHSALTYAMYIGQIPMVCAFTGTCGANHSVSLNIA